MSDPFFIVDGHKLSVSNSGKILFPDAGVTKGDIVEYYRRIAPIALPHYKDRPLTMQRFPDGIDSEGFFQKDIPDYFPDWIERIELGKKDGIVTHVVANNAATLVYLANQACITPHLALMRTIKPRNPDRLIFDLDPSDDDFSKIQEVANLLKEALDKRGVPCFVQTTGSRGLHIVVPLDQSASFDETRNFSRALAQKLANANPRLITIESRKVKRGDRVFVDTLRNAYGQTAVAPYAVRARSKVTIATPLDWNEALAAGMRPQKYNLSNIFQRLGSKNDPWARINEFATGLARYENTAM